MAFHAMYLITTEAQDQNSPLLLMAMAGCYDGLKLLLSAKADIEKSSKVIKNRSSSAGVCWTASDLGILLSLVP